jgi:hypothetical protein
LIFLSDDLPDVFLCLEPCGHDLMTAPKAPQAKIRTGSQNLPAFIATGMLLFHNKHIIEPNIHGNLLGISGALPQ